uniref:Uncharacterized protein n=1 Tax=Oryza sativa subsp. japonica TaxID=39947 RepID=Q5Z7J9_ORYSJ|nr:hypothetical protein [Oryza sativa Japonica Group]
MASGRPHTAHPIKVLHRLLAKTDILRRQRRKRRLVLGRRGIPAKRSADIALPWRPPPPPRELMMFPVATAVGAYWPEAGGEGSPESPRAHLVHPTAPTTAPSRPPAALALCTQPRPHPRLPPPPPGRPPQSPREPNRARLALPATLPPRHPLLSGAHRPVPPPRRAYHRSSTSSGHHSSPSSPRFSADIPLPRHHPPPAIARRHERRPPTAALAC